MKVVQMVAGGLLVGSLALAGCSKSGTAEPTGTATPPRGSIPQATGPTATPTLSVREQSIAAAEAAFLHYNDAQNASAQNSYEGWMETVQPLLTGEFMMNRYNHYQRRLGGYRQTGADKVEILDVKSADAGEVVLMVCADDSDVDVIGPDGTSAYTGLHARQLVEVTVRRTLPADPETGELLNDEDPQQQDWWRIGDLVVQSGETC